MTTQTQTASAFLAGLTCCPDCKGTGYVDFPQTSGQIRCKACEGTGTGEVPKYKSLWEPCLCSNFPDVYEGFFLPHECNGTGYTVVEPRLQDLLLEALEQGIWIEVATWSEDLLAMAIEDIARAEGWTH